MYCKITVRFEEPSRYLQETSRRLDLNTGRDDSTGAERTVSLEARVERIWTEFR